MSYTIAVIILVLLAFTAYYLFSKKEAFESEVSWMPLYIYGDPEGSDFKLFDYLQKLKLDNSDPIWNGVATTSSSRNLFVSPKMSPLVFVPGIGSVPIYIKSNEECLKSTEYEKIWPSKNSECWKKLVLQKSNMAVQEFGSLDFSYANELMRAFESLGYIKGENLFGAPYNFIDIENTIDGWFRNMKNLIEKHCALQGHPAILIGHDLGSVLANYFLVMSDQAWKNKYIKSFITIGGGIGGCPKAFRTYAEDNISKTFDGVKLLLPDPLIYGDTPLFSIDQLVYSSKDIPKFIKISPKLMRIKEKSMLAPGVTVHILGGLDQNTESSYSYGPVLGENLQINKPYYSNSKNISRNFFTGDGTMCKTALEFPVTWTKSQDKPLFYRFFANTGHVSIISTLYPIQHIINIIKKI